jgi:alkylation response protein AidB-like acyl-CoA dehydrogenase
MRAWIATHRVPALEALDTPGGRRLAEGLFYGLWMGSPGPLADAYAEWSRLVQEAGLMCPQWPEEVGGRGWDGIRCAIYAEECAAQRMPRVTRGLGEQMVGPAIVAHGSAAQRAYFLPRILAGEDYYAQGFSEPDAGSDLAAIRTTGKLEGDEIVIDGQKIWTSVGWTANKMFLLCRTDPTAGKHRGITYVILDVQSNKGRISLRPTRQMDGRAEFSEEFFDGARAPLFNVIGGLGNGWKVAMTTLGSERGAHATTQHIRYAKMFSDLVAEARLRNKIDDPKVRDDLAWAFTQVELMRYSGMRMLADLAADAKVGPESSMYKLFSSEFGQRLSEMAIEMLGAAALERPAGEQYEVSDWQAQFLVQRASTIMAGSSQIQRNILGERVLGLPKEP